MAAGHTCMFKSKSHTWRNCCLVSDGRVNKRLRMLTNSSARVVQPSLQSPETRHSNPSSLRPLHVKWKVCGHREKRKKGLFCSAAHTGSRLIKVLRQSSKFLVVCLLWQWGEISSQPALLGSVCWNKSCVLSGARQQSLPVPAVCHASLLAAVRRSELGPLFL